MTRVAWVADVHLGNHKRKGGPVQAGLNDRCLRACRVFQKALLRAQELKCDAVVVLGDLLDYDRPEAQLLAHVQGILDETDTAKYLVLGNHEQRSDQRGDHALGPLMECDSVMVVERPELVRFMDGCTLALVPYAPRVASEYLTESLGQLLDGNDDAHVVLGVHMGISDASTVPWLKGVQDSVPVEFLRGELRDWNMQAAFAGNWHDRRLWPGDGVTSAPVLQLGALVPTGWDNPGASGYGTLAVWDSQAGKGGGLTVEELPGPRFVVERVASKAAATHPDLYLQIIAEPEEHAMWVAHYAQLLEQGKIAGFEVLADGAVAKEQALAAGAVAKQAGSAAAALEAYVAKMPLGAGVDRARVLTEARRFLGS